jgi:hypothetical protein
MVRENILEEGELCSFWQSAQEWWNQSRQGSVDR